MAESKFTIYDFIILGVTVLLLIGSLLLSLFSPNLMNPLTTFSFQLLTLVATVYIAFKLTKIAVMNKTIELQKNTAKTAIRHIRGYQRNLDSLIKIIKEKVEKTSSEKQKDSLTEINHHLENFRIGIALSENDFKDILGDEFKEEHSLLLKVMHDLEESNSKIKQLEDLRKEDETGNKEKIQELTDEIDRMRERISENILDMPISGWRGNIIEQPAFSKAILDAYERSSSLSMKLSDAFSGIKIPDSWKTGVKLSEEQKKQFVSPLLSIIEEKEEQEGNKKEEPED